MSDLDSLGRRIAYLRTKNNLTQRQLMDILDFENLSRYENDERKPNLDLIISLSKYFKVSNDWLLTGMSPNPDVENFLQLFNQLTNFEKGKIIGRMEEIIERH